jgi:transcriptional regulator with XRE-family HTH domain
MTAPSRLADLIGARVRSLRQARGLSVNALAAAAGVSAGIVSQIERDRANPSLNTIEKICTALGVTTDAILATEPTANDPPFVARTGSHQRILVGAAPIVKEMLSPPGNRSLRMMHIALPPRSENLDVVTGIGQKAGWVMEGEIRVVVDGQAARLLRGDSFQFNSAQPHSLHNDGEAPAKVFWIIVEGVADGAF